MWRTFYKEYDGYLTSVDEFLNLIEADGYEPRFISYSHRHSVADPHVVYVTARKKSV